MKLTVNGQKWVLEGVDPTMPLLWAIRDLLGLKGTKFGCGQALCGACTVHMDGQPVRSCQTSLADVGDSKVTTIEAIAGRVAEAVRSARIKNNVPHSLGPFHPNSFRSSAFATFSSVERGISSTK